MDSYDVPSGSYAVRIIADSIQAVASASNIVGNRLTTFQLTYPRFIHPEFLTHRMISRNSQSSRAMPTSKIIEQVAQHPVMPVEWGKNCKGMVANGLISEMEAAQEIWLGASQSAIQSALLLQGLGVHKQVVNRLLEPYSTITTIATATDWLDFFRLRCAEDAQPEIRHLALAMSEQYYEHEPTLLGPSGWHLPYIPFEEMGDKTFSNDTLARVSTARCARVSLLNHLGTRDIDKDLKLCDMLEADRHMSPFEHAAMALYTDERVANFSGFRSYRSMLGA